MNFAHSEVATLDPNTMRTLCEEYVANNYIDPETSERLGVKRGLRNPDGTGVLAGLTNVCDVVGYKKDQEGHVIPTHGKLIYRGVNIDEIVDGCQLPAGRVLASMTLLEVKGYIRRLPARRFSLAEK